jgi:hypothetical protein
VKTNCKYNFTQDGSKKSGAKWQYEIEENERIGIVLTNTQTGEESEIKGFFLPGVLTITWERGVKIG